MDNHQSELAEELADRKHLYCASPQTLHQTIANMDLSSLFPYSPGDATPVAKHINNLLGFPDDWSKAFFSPLSLGLKVFVRDDNHFM